MVFFLNSQNSNNYSNKGFSLVELMIVVAIIGIIAAIAIPTYNGYIQTARQAKAEAELLQLPILLEQYRAESLSGDLCPGGSCDTNSYTEINPGTTGISAFLPGFEATPSPTDGINYTYNILFTSDTEATLTVTLTGNVANVYSCSFPEGTCP